MSQSEQDMPEYAEAGEMEAAEEAAQNAADEAESRILQAEEAVRRLQEELLRSRAEMDNVRKRAEKQAAESSKFAIERFARELLDITDNLERALSAPEGNEAALREGVQLTVNSWHTTTAKFGLERVDAAGQPFNPNLHQAMLQMPHELPTGTVVSQHQAGYTLHGRLLRPASVIVSSGPVQSPVGS